LWRRREDREEGAVKGWVVVVIRKSLWMNRRKWWMGWCMIVFHSLLCCVVDEVFMKEEADGIYYSGENGG